VSDKCLSGKVSNNGECDHNAQCRSSICNPETGKCSSELAADAVCTDKIQCRSDVCYPKYDCVED